MSPRTLCAVLFTSGCVMSAAIVILCGSAGFLLAIANLAIAWMAADRADPTKWSET
jgi:hypothetical protein